MLKNDRKYCLIWILVLMAAVLFCGCGTENGDTDVKQFDETGALTELATEPATHVVRVGNDTITINGAVYTAAAPWGAPTDTVVGTVSTAEEVDRLGMTAYATDLAGYVTVVNGEQTWYYRYVGAVTGGTMADWLAAYGANAQTVTRVDLQDKTRDSEVTNGEIVTFTPHRAVVTDTAQIAALLGAMAELPRDAAGYEAVVAVTEEPYEGYIRVTLLESNSDGSMREWGSFVWYPKINFVNDGYQTDAAFAALLGELLG